MIQSPLLTSLMALCIFSLFSLVMLGQRYTTPMVTVVCPVTNLHYMASFAHSYLFLCTECLVQRLRAGFYPDEWRLINAL